MPKPETISDRLGKRRSAKVAILTDTRDNSEYDLSLVPDTSSFGKYSVRAKHGDKHTESFRMFYEGMMPLEDAMQHFMEYLNTDTKGEPFKIIPLAPPKPKKQKEPGTILDSWKAQLKQLKKKRYKTGPEENFMKVLESRIKANVDKWEMGDGVGWKVLAGGGMTQTNRGFRIIDIAPDHKMALLTQVADTGLTVTGGEDAIEDIWVPLGDLVRDRKYDME